MKKSADNGEQSPDDKKTWVREAFQEFLIDFLSGSSKIEVTDPAVRAQQHAFVQKHLEVWQESRRCIVEGCKADAIRRSHALQKAGPLQFIAEKGFVVAPRSHAGQYGMAMRKVAISAASTFPGFCLRHEQLFHDFEQQRRLRHDKDFILQAYRATCREIVRLQIEHTYFEKNAHLFHQTHGQLLEIDLARRIRTKGKDIASAEIRPFLDRSERTDPDPFDVLLQTAFQDLQKLRSAHLRGMEEVIFGTSRTTLPLIVVPLPMEIPVCLSGMDCVNLSVGGRERRILVILNVIPEPNRTYIIGYAPSEDRDVLVKYMGVIDGLFPGLNTVESAMLHSTDHWFLRPSVWDKLPKRRQNQILSEITLRDGNAFQATAHSIFDKLRLKLLKRLVRTNPESLPTEIVQEVVAREEAKIAGIPNAEKLWMPP